MRRRRSDSEAARHCLCIAVLTLMLAARSSGVKGQQHGYSAVCAVAKNENRYVREWLTYHKCIGEHTCIASSVPMQTGCYDHGARCVGINKIYLYDHQSIVPLDGEIKDFLEQGFAEYISFNGQIVNACPPPRRL